MGDDSTLSALQKELSNVKKLQKEYTSLRNQRQLLNGQLNENEIVKLELNQIGDDDEVFKLIGPVLVKQDLAEAKINVGKRMDYIKEEVRRVNDNISATETKLQKAQERFAKVQAAVQEKNAASAAASKQ